MVLSSYVDSDFMFVMFIGGQKIWEALFFGTRFPRHFPRFFGVLTPFFIFFGKLGRAFSYI